MITRTCVDADLRAFHTDPVNDPAINEGRHEHVWNVQLVYEGEVLRDARCFRAALTNVLSVYQGQDLPWWSAEEIAKAMLCVGTGDPIGCIVTRPGFKAEVWRKAKPKQEPPPPHDDVYWLDYGTVNDRG